MDINKNTGLSGCKDGLAHFNTRSDDPPGIAENIKDIV
jgi:hypothetical protein